MISYWQNHFYPCPHQGIPLLSPGKVLSATHEPYRDLTAKADHRALRLPRSTQTQGYTRIYCEIFGEIYLESSKFKYVYLSKLNKSHVLLFFLLILVIRAPKVQKHN